MNKKLQNKIDKFLKEKRKCTDGGFAEVDQEDLVQLGEIISMLISKKFEADCDGDYPINYKLINRHLYENSYFLNIPYKHKDPEGHIKAITTNLSINSKRLDSFFNVAKIKVDFD